MPWGCARPRSLRTAGDPSPCPATPCTNTHTRVWLWVCKHPWVCAWGCARLCTRGSSTAHACAHVYIPCACACAHLRRGRGAALAARAWSCCARTCCRTRPARGRPRSQSSTRPPAGPTVSPTAPSCPTGGGRSRGAHGAGARPRGDPAGRPATGTAPTGGVPRSPLVSPLPLGTPPLSHLPPSPPRCVCQHVARVCIEVGSQGGGAGGYLTMLVSTCVRHGCRSRTETSAPSTPPAPPGPARPTPPPGDTPGPPRRGTPHPAPCAPSPTFPPPSLRRGLGCSPGAAWRYANWIGR